MPIALAMIALLGGVLRFFQSRRPIGLRGTLSGLEACPSGEAWIARLQEKNIAVLRWNERGGSVHLKGPGSTSTPLVPLEDEQRISVVRAFAELELNPAAPFRPPLGDGSGFVVGGKCEDQELESVPVYTQDLVATLREASLTEAPRAIMYSLNGRGWRAESLLRRMEGFAR